MSKRLVFSFCILCFMAMFLITRLYSLATNESLLNTATEQSTYSIEFNKTRAQIYDCKLNPLTDVNSKKIFAYMPTNESVEGLKNQKAIKTQSPISELIKTGRPFLMDGAVPDKLVGAVELSTPIRREANGLAQHIIGYLDQSGNGVCGIEKAYNDFLKSESDASKISYLVNSRREPLMGVLPSISYAPILSKGVVLTLDSRIQEVVETVGNKLLKKGAIVVMEPFSGKLKAVASFPSYNTDTLLKAVKDSENSPLLNRAFSAYSVGSTFKIATAATALSQGISEDTVFECKGFADISGQIFSCHQKSGHGFLNMKQAMEVSCNPYFIQLGLKLDKTRFLNIARDLSFGKSVNLAKGIDVSAGILPDLDLLASKAAVGNFSFGQGVLSATPIQIAQMMSAVVNGGKTPRAQLIEGMTTNGKIIDEPLLITPPIVAFESDIAKIIKRDLISSVMEVPAQKAKPKYIDAGGKTGTAQTGQIKKDGSELLQGWFAGFFPAENPKYVVVVLSEDAQSGNKNASPVFSEIADALYEPIYFKEPTQVE